jgi:hypothetical protein
MTDNERILFNAVFGEDYQEGLPDLPDAPQDGAYFWTSVKCLAIHSDQPQTDKSGRIWYLAFEWIYKD